MAILKTGRSHRARKELFQKGLTRGFLTVQEIESALPQGALTAAERWLLYYSLRAAEVEIRDESGELVTVPALSTDELQQLAEERDAATTPPDGSSASPRHDARPAEIQRAEEALASLEPDHG